MISSANIRLRDDNTNFQPCGRINGATMEHRSTTLLALRCRERLARLLHYHGQDRFTPVPGVYSGGLDQSFLPSNKA